MSDVLFVLRCSSEADLKVLINAEDGERRASGTETETIQETSSCVSMGTYSGAMVCVNIIKKIFIIFSERLHQSTQLFTVGNANPAALTGGCM